MSLGKESKLAIEKIYNLVKKNPKKYGVLLTVLNKIDNSVMKNKSNSLGYKRVLNVKK